MVSLVLPRLVDVAAASRRSASVAERNVAALESVYWLLLISGFVEPLLYLLSIGVGRRRAGRRPDAARRAGGLVRRPSSPRRCSPRRR